MANCCEYSFLCEGLATIGFMRTLIPSVMSSCVSVSNGRTATTCCGNMSEANYIPKYSEITGGTFAPIRVIADTPSDDVNGFTYSTPTLVQTNCCTGDTLANEALMKSQLGFEYTSPVSCSFINKIEPTPCDLTYKATVLKQWERHRYECDANFSGNIKHIVTPVTNTSEQRSGSLDRIIRESSSGNRYEYTFSFNSVTVSAETKVNNVNPQCASAVSASTSFSAETYTEGFSLICPGVVPCSGISGYTIATIDKIKCNGEIVLEITCDIEDTPEVYTLVGSSGSSVSQPITIGENNNNRSGGTITVRANVCGNVYTHSCEFERETCQPTPPTPTVLSGEGCSIYVNDILWSGVPGVKWHPYK